VFDGFRKLAHAGGHFFLQLESDGRQVILGFIALEAGSLGDARPAAGIFEFPLESKRGAGNGDGDNGGVTFLDILELPMDSVRTPRFGCPVRTGAKWAIE
jgi:hypothetical protein